MLSFVVPRWCWKRHVRVGEKSGNSAFKRLRILLFVSIYLDGRFAATQQSKAPWKSAYCKHMFTHGRPEETLVAYRNTPRAYCDWTSFQATVSLQRHVFFEVSEPEPSRRRLTVWLHLLSHSSKVFFCKTSRDCNPTVCRHPRVLDTVETSPKVFVVVEAVKNLARRTARRHSSTLVLAGLDQMFPRNHSGCTEPSVS